ncbi:MAG TPA: hypothetical protein VIM10_12240 [Actinopolymorphaceae bacterium]|jgi:uncharacterized protein (DUF849 family)
MAVPAIRRPARSRAELRLQARIGLEDLLNMPDGTLAPNNTALVKTARTFSDRPT